MCGPARIAASRSHQALRDSLEQACCLPARTAWDRKVTAHAEIANLLADAAADPILALLAGNVPGGRYGLLMTCGAGVAASCARPRRRSGPPITHSGAGAAVRPME